MVLSFKDKQVIITKVTKIVKDALSLVVANTNGVSVNKMTELRKICRESGVYLYVIRNTLICRIVEGTIYECLKKVFIGPTLIAFSMKHPGVAARLFKEFSKINTEFQIKASSFQGEFIPGNQIDRLATLPTYEEAIVRLILIMKETSIGKLIRIIAALRNQKEAA
ncbi:MAG: 50S ribosomal protein L10 [Arsenophonus endosymbiont of Ceratovacuna japonica]